MELMNHNPILPDNPKQQEKPDNLESEILETPKYSASGFLKLLAHHLWIENNELFKKIDEISEYTNLEEKIKGDGLEYIMNVIRVAKKYLKILKKDPDYAVYASTLKYALDNPFFTYSLIKKDEE